MIFDSRSQPHGSPSLDGATIRHPKSRDWEPCAKCGERLEFGTNGMGKLVPECPVCDWGWRPSRDYEAYKQRVRVDEVTREEAFPTKHYIYNADGSITRDCRCGTRFPPSESGQRYCSDRCKRDAYKEAQRRVRAKWDAAGLCTQCGREPQAPGLATGAKCLAAKRRNGRGSEALRRYWQAKGAR